MQVAARYSTGTGARVLGDFYDVFPPVRGGWGLVVANLFFQLVSARYERASLSVTSSKPSGQGSDSSVLASSG
ncbi:MAG: hypothetical protein ACLPKI_04525 [Streptosporangiaceae bacterium]